MRLKAYLETEGQSLTELSARTGIKVTTLHGYMTLRRIPNAVNVARIEAATNGLVCAADHVPEGYTVCAA
jgi:lambda repressor-like predicted transcriptional regulator